MTLLAPLFAWLAPLALMPVVFHLFFRVRKQQRLFPSLMFFLAADPRLSSRRRLREWLVLALRCLALLAVLLALARPVVKGRGAQAALVAIVDNSASMGTVGRDGQTWLSRAVSGAAALIEDREVQVRGLTTTVSDPQAAVPAGMAADAAPLLAALAGLRATHASGNPAAAVLAAGRSVAGAMRGSGELHIFTDLHAAEWDRPAAALDLPPGVSLVVHDVAAEGETAGTVTLERAGVAGRLPAPGRPWRITARLRNAGDGAADASVNAQVPAAGDDRTSAPARVPASGSQTVELALRPLAPGLAAIRVWVDGAAAAPAAETWLGLRIAGPEPVWFLGGEALYGLLPAAVAPDPAGTLTGLVPEGLPPDRLAAELQLRRPRLIVTTPEHLGDASLAAACHDYVKSGGLLLVTPSATLPPAAARLPVWCGAQWGEPRHHDAPQLMSAADPADVLWADFRSADGSVQLDGVHLSHLLPVLPSSGRSVAAAAGDTVLAVQAVGSGRVCISGLAFDTAWSNLPRRAPFLALAQGFAAAPAGVAASVDAIAGRPLSAIAAATSDVPATVRGLAGDSGQWHGQGATLPAPVRAGVYSLDQEGRRTLLSVAGDPAEGDPRRVRGRTVPLLAGVPHRVDPYRDGVELVQAVRQARHGRSLFGPLLLLAVLAFCGETLAADGFRPGGRRP